MTSRNPINTLIKDTLEPGDMVAGGMVQNAASEDDQIATPNAPQAGMVISDLESAGWTYLYPVQTKERSLVNNNAVAEQMKLRDENNVPVFTQVYPGEPWRGEFKCFLHADQPEREMFNQMGFPVCERKAIPSKYQAELHGHNRHRQEWLAYQKVITDAREDENREIARRTLAVMEANAGVSAVTRPQRTPEEQAKMDERMRKVRDSRAAKATAGSED